MADRPKRASEYASEHLARVRSLCLYIATKLGDLTEEMTVVGGLAPTLLIDPDRSPERKVAHVGTMDLDLGLRLSVLEKGRYRALTERLRDAGLEMDRNDRGRPTRQRWKLAGRAPVTVDFLIPPSRPSDRGGELRDIEPEFGAIIAPGLELAFLDRRRVALAGRTPFGEEATRDVWVCGAGAFVVLKALAFDGRGESKDAYDLDYVLRWHGRSVDDVAEALSPLRESADTRRAIEVLRRDFLTHDAVGPRRVAEFLFGAPDDETQADVAGFTARLLDRLGSARESL